VIKLVRQKIKNCYGWIYNETEYIRIADAETATKGYFITEAELEQVAKEVWEASQDFAAVLEMGTIEQLKRTPDWEKYWTQKEKELGE
jgi:hypothetical protein